MHENRETSSLAAGSSGSPAGEGDSRTPGMNGGEESDRTVVPMTPANKAEVQQAEAAELAEGRVRTKQNASGEHTSPTQSGYGVPQRLAGVRRVAVWFGATSCEVGAVCGSSARTDLCGGRSVMIVPTATRNPPVPVTHP
jgi:hypothetical protein